MRALGAVLVLALIAPLAFTMGRTMFRRRQQETTMSDDPTEIITAQEPDEQDPQAAVREQAMAAPDLPDSSDTIEELAVQRRYNGPADTMAGEWDSLPHHRVADPDAERRWADEGIPQVIERGTPGLLFTTSGPQPLVRPTRIDCEHCGGRGFVPGINDLLQESSALLGDQGDEVIRLFYSTLLRAHPQLLTLFPGDPTQGDFGSDHKGAIQRDRLLKALTALAGMYDPGDPGKMAHLDQALASFGRAHASFVRQDGTIRGATLEEYAAVKEALFATLVRVTGDRWKPEYTEAWSQAYDYATAVMLAEQFRSGFTAPRFPRAAQ